MTWPAEVQRLTIVVAIFSIIIRFGNLDEFFAKALAGF
jgi:hypothetical protein